MVTSNRLYIHGFSRKEQNRLFDQAKFLEDELYHHVDLRASRNLIEVGSGVGAQTEILLRRFPKMKITGIDASPEQLKVAQSVHRASIKTGRVTFKQADAGNLPFKAKSFDAAFICWLLEHVPSPLKVLKSVHKVLQPGAVIYCTEAFNSSIYTFPESPHVQRYWDVMNSKQRAYGGDPDVGVKLGGLLKSAGFKDIVLEPVTYHRDARSPSAGWGKTVTYWKELFMSGAPKLSIADGIDAKFLKAVKDELTTLHRRKDAVFYLSAMQAHARR